MRTRHPQSQRLLLAVLFLGQVLAVGCGGGTTGTGVLGTEGATATDAAAVLCGTITDDRGLPLSGIQVQILDESQNDANASMAAEGGQAVDVVADESPPAVSDENGSFAVSNTPAVASDSTEISTADASDSSSSDVDSQSSPLSEPETVIIQFSGEGFDPASPATVAATIPATGENPQVIDLGDGRTATITVCGTNEVQQEF